MLGIFDRDKWQEIFATIRKNKLRTILTALGVFWGIFMLVFLLGMGKGLENGVFKGFGSRAKNIMFVWANQTTLAYDGYAPGRRVYLHMKDLDILKKQVEELDQIIPRNEMSAKPIVYQDKSNNYSIRGELSGMDKVDALVIYEGRYLNKADVEKSRKVVSLGVTVRDELFGEKVNPVGEHILISGIDFMVIGVHGPEQIKEWTRDDMESVVMPLPTMSGAFASGDKIDFMICTAKPGYHVADMEKKIRRILKEINSVSPDDPRGIGGFNLEKEFQQIQSLFLGIKLFLWFVGIGTLLAGIIGVSNIMLIIVKERTKEIGIRKALGATPRSIINMILTESIFITALSGYLGLLIGTLMIWGIDTLLEMAGADMDNFYHPEVNLYVGIVALVVLIVSGAIAGLIPAIQASKVNPVVALKDE